MSVLVIGDADALALAGAAPGPGDPRVVVVLDDAPAPERALVPVVRWWRGPSGGALGADRVVATGGDGLWSRAPWPVADALFDPPAPLPGRVLVVEAGARAREATLAELALRGVAADGADRLTAAALAGADVVLHGVGTAGPLPGDAFAVLAAGRLLIGGGEPAFGLRAGVEYLAAGVPPLACDLAESALAAPEAFAAQRRLGRMAAERHRASAAYARL